MTTVFLNGEFMPIEEASISPMDRGFLFGDGVYEVIPSYTGRFVGLEKHIQRLQNGLALTGINLNWDTVKWRSICQELIASQPQHNLGVYIQVSRGADSKRAHTYPEGVTPTVFAYAFDIPGSCEPDKAQVKNFTVTTTRDLRWRNCHIKSTSLLGNVMHAQQGMDSGHNETLLFNSRNELTEASACNVFMVKQSVIITPPLDNQILPGVTRSILIDIIKRHTKMAVVERVITMDELQTAEEIWLTSSTKEVAPVIEMDGKPVGNGEVGDLWLTAYALYIRHKTDYH